MINLTEAHLRLDRARVDHKKLVLEFMMKEGPNEWQYLPFDEIEVFLDQIDELSSAAFIVSDRDRLVGVSTCRITNDYEVHEVTRDRGLAGVVDDVVVDREYVGCGIGSVLLSAGTEYLFAQGATRVFAERHEENHRSAMIMRRVGFSVIKVFDDSKRNSGSSRTAVGVVTPNTFVKQYLN